MKVLEISIKDTEDKTNSLTMEFALGEKTEEILFSIINEYLDNTTIHELQECVENDNSKMVEDIRNKYIHKSSLDDNVTIFTLDTIIRLKLFQIYKLRKVKSYTDDLTRAFDVLQYTIDKYYLTSTDWVDKVYNEIKWMPHGEKIFNWIFV